MSDIIFEAAIWETIEKTDAGKPGKYGLTQCANFFLTLLNRVTPTLHCFSNLNLRYKFIKEIQIQLLECIFLELCLERTDEDPLGIFFYTCVVPAKKVKSL